MKIQNTSSNANFKAYYKVPYDSRTALLNRSGIMPSYGFINNEPALTFVGDNILAGVFNKQLERIAKAAGGTVEWLKNNARNYGLKVPDSDMSHLTVVTGLKDIRDIENFAIENHKSYGKFALSTFAKVYKSLKFIFNNENKLPSHIISLNLVMKDYMPHLNKFKKFMANKTQINLHTIEEITLYQKF